MTDYQRGYEAGVQASKKAYDAVRLERDNAWKEGYEAGQRDMRERVMKEIVYWIDDYNNACDLIEAIAALPIEEKLTNQKEKEK